MFALIWVTLLFTATGSVQSDNKTCESKPFTLTLKPTHQTAAAGQCVVFECSFENNVTSFAWCKTDQSGECNIEIFNSSKNSTAGSEIGGRVSLLEPDLKKKNCSIIIKNLTTSDAGVYKIRAGAADNCTHVSKANITVEVQEINITSEIALLEDKNMTLTCSVPAFCFGSKPQFTWMFGEEGKKEMLAITDNNTEFMINMMNPTQSHTSSLTFKPSAKHYNMIVTCKADFPGNTSIEKTLNMSFSPRISSSSRCWTQSNLLTCVCISEGFPSPNITWSLLDSISEYSLSTNVSALSVTSNITVPLKKFSNFTVECVSRNNIGETKKNLSISKANQPGNSNHQNLFSRLVELFKGKMISVLIVFGVGFLTGSLVTTLIACLVAKCHRNKKKNSDSTDELELVNAEAVFKDWDNEVPHVENNGVLDIMAQDDETLVFQDDGIQNQAAAECEEELHGDLTDLDMSPKEAVYSDIDFSALKEKDPADAKKKEDTTETEYAEIKRGEMEEVQENEGMDCKMLEGIDETEVMIEHQEEAKQNVVAEEVIGEADPLYHNKNEVMDEN
ncbi:sialic acid-binding Ig-like lectin 7 [Poecilia formosa]|uniref:Sialic acid-binding Ig-like lectin 7 n=1 Tax=Poecilia formosa TaxID=48698 RepID=A0A096LY23_POEFO|nr:PREDICTED: sialic acid-binding Ig-like lectin 7 [Poecilia formosa]